MRVAILTFLLGLGGCCDGCRCAKKYVTSPDKEPAAELVKDRLRTDKEIAKKLCGVDAADGVTVTKIEVDVTLQQGKVHIEGTPIKAPEKKCLGVLGVIFGPLATDDSGKVTAWEITSLDVDEVKTPGHEWKKPVSTVDD